MKREKSVRQATLILGIFCLVMNLSQAGADDDFTDNTGDEKKQVTKQAPTPVQKKKVVQVRKLSPALKPLKVDPKIQEMFDLIQALDERTDPAQDKKRVKAVNLRSSENVWVARASRAESTLVNSMLVPLLSLAQHLIAPTSKPKFARS